MDERDNFLSDLSIINNFSSNKNSLKILRASALDSIESAGSKKEDDSENEIINEINNNENKRIGNISTIVKQDVYDGNIINDSRNYNKYDIRHELINSYNSNSTDKSNKNSKEFQDENNNKFDLNNSKRNNINDMNTLEKDLSDGKTTGRKNTFNSDNHSDNDSDCNPQKNACKKDGKESNFLFFLICFAPFFVTFLLYFKR